MSVTWHTNDIRWPSLLMGFAERSAKHSTWQLFARDCLRPDNQLNVGPCDQPDCWLMVPANPLSDESIFFTCPTSNVIYDVRCRAGEHILVEMALQAKWGCLMGLISPTCWDRRWGPLFVLYWLAAAVQDIRQDNFSSSTPEDVGGLKQRWLHARQTLYHWAA